ncbi:hypothetical protein [Streptomyces sp. NRRL F-5650]|uniref:hypothetical protein n=1 Tax=Streptomyces sp. NRRL F-5650 TaxID=1463868 RepID=UPI001F423A80|nr:hypothetical protein [Streptomyces sp. NRRL F-5650]
MSTRSVIARPVGTGFCGVYVHHDGYPSGRLPLLLAAYQHRFAGDIDALTEYLIDRVPIGWSSLGADLLAGVPASLRAELTSPRMLPGRQYDEARTPDAPPVRVTDAVAGGLDWGYVLHPHLGIEVIPLRREKTGPVVPWDTDPRTRFSDHQVLWASDRPVPATRPPNAMPPSPSSSASAAATALARPAQHPARPFR